MRAIFYAWFLLLISACSNVHKKERLAPALSSWLPADTLAVAQYIDIHRANKSWQLQAMLEGNAGGIKLLLMSELGQRLFLLDYDGEQLSNSKYVVVPMPFDEAYILQSLQFSFWPDQALNELEPLGYSFNFYEDGRREIFYKGELYAERVLIDGCDKKVELHQYTYKFVLTIQSQNLLHQTDKQGDYRADDCIFPSH
ncbi:DUF3261 domain-containing protein [Agaribacterium sp. ZY112]|uniref:DUF3261 domain-containing protein n=1 Tax=Agaribacterium sp. ZY112 TaxID=3233574 RepID=UPI00352638AE